MSLSIAGDTIEDFLNNIFNPQFQLKEIYTNKNEERNDKMILEPAGY